MDNILYSVAFVHANRPMHFFGVFTSETFALDAVKEHINSNIVWFREFWSTRTARDNSRLEYLSELELKFKNVEHSFAGYERFMNCDVYAICADINYGKTKIRVYQCRLNEVLPEPEEKFKL